MSIEEKVESLYKLVEQLEKRNIELERKIILLNSFKIDDETRGYSNFIYHHANEGDEFYLQALFSYFSSIISGGEFDYRLDSSLQKVIDEDRNMSSELTIDRAYNVYREFFSNVKESILNTRSSKEEFITMLHAMMSEKWHHKTVAYLLQQANQVALVPESGQSDESGGSSDEVSMINGAKREEKVAIARNKLRMGLDVSLIAEATGLCIEELEQMKQADAK